MNNFTQNNKFGDNTMNFGPQPRSLNEQTKSQLSGLIKENQKVTVTAVMGDGEAFNFATQIKNYLAESGYEVSGVNQAVYGQPIQGQFIQPPKTNDEAIEIIIGNNILP